MYEYAIGASILLFIWILLYLKRKDLRKNMLFSSFLVTPLAISDYIFIPSYWNPGTLFNLVPGIESFLFAFSTGGIAAVLYKILNKKSLKRTKNKTQGYILIIPVYLILIISFFIESLKTKLIYTSSLAMLFGTTIIWFYRKDLIKSSIVGMFYFTLIYTGMLLILDRIIFPGSINMIWVFDSNLNIFILGIPIEEIFWSLTFSSLWASIYEYIKGYKIKSL